MHEDPWELWDKKTWALAREMPSSLLYLPKVRWSNDTKKNVTLQSSVKRYNNVVICNMLNPADFLISSFVIVVNIIN